MKRNYLLLTFMMSSGCLADAWSNLQDNFTTTTTTTATTGGPTTSGTVPTTSDGVGSSPVATVTGPPDDTTWSSATTMPETTTGAPGVNLPPTIELFTASPEHVSEAGQVKLELTASDDVAVVKVRLELDGETITELAPAKFPYFFDVLSAKYNGNQRKFKAVALDAEGLSDETEVEVTMDLPAPGAEKCIFEDKDANFSVISALKYTPDAIVAVGTRDTGAGLRLTVWKLDADHCHKVLWVKSIANWTAKPALAKMMSLGSAVDVDEDGNIVVAGNFITGGKPQSYVARLNPDGARLWEKEGQVGDTVNGVAAAREQFKNRVFVVGSRRTNDVPERTDAAIWTYMAIDGNVSLSSWLTLKAPFTPGEFDADEWNDRSEWVWAVVIQPGTGYAMAVGEREFWNGINLPYYRAFAVFVHPLGDLVGTPWTSTADASLLHDAARSVTVCGDGFLAGGWTRDEPPDSKPHPMVFWIGPDGALKQHRAEPQLPSTQINGIACDREGKIVSAGTRTTVSPDAQVFTVLGPFGPRISYETGVQGNDGAGAVACDWRGICGWGGYRTANMKPYAFVRVHHP